MRKLGEKLCDVPPQIVSVAECLHPHPGAAGIPNILFTLRNRVEARRKFAWRGEYVDLKSKRAVPRQRLQDVPQRRVRDEAAVPVEFTVDFDRGKARR